MDIHDETSSSNNLYIILLYITINQEKNKPFIPECCTVLYMGITSHLNNTGESINTSTKVQNRLPDQQDKVWKR